MSCLNCDLVSIAELEASAAIVAMQTIRLAAIERAGSLQSYHARCGKPDNTVKGYISPAARREYLAQLRQKQSEKLANERQNRIAALVDMVQRAEKNGIDWSSAAGVGCDDILPTCDSADLSPILIRLSMIGDSDKSQVYSHGFALECLGLTIDNLDIDHASADRNSGIREYPSRVIVR
jgi:hypothetical protein